MARALEENTDYNGYELVIERPDGSRRTALAYANPIHDEAGMVVGAVNVLVDISERKHAENLLRDANRRKSEFLAMLAHELRNPLAPLRNGLQIIRLASHDGAAVAKAHLVMERQLGHMVRLIDDLLDLSRISNGKIDLRKERLDLTLAVQDAVETSRPLIEARGASLGHATAQSGLRGSGPDPAGPGVCQPAQQQCQVHRAGRSHLAYRRATRQRCGGQGQG